MICALLRELQRKPRITYLSMLVLNRSLDNVLNAVGLTLCGQFGPHSQHCLFTPCISVRTLENVLNPPRYSSHDAQTRRILTFSRADYAETHTRLPECVICTLPDFWVKKCMKHRAAAWPFFLVLESKWISVLCLNFEHDVVDVFVIVG